MVKPILHFHKWNWCSPKESSCSKINTFQYNCSTSADYPGAGSSWKLSSFQCALKNNPSCLSNSIDAHIKLRSLMSAYKVPNGTAPYLNPLTNVYVATLSFRLLKDCWVSVPMSSCHHLDNVCSFSCVIQ